MIKSSVSAVAAAALLSLAAPALAAPPAAAPAPIPAPAAAPAPGVAEAVALLKLYSPYVEPTLHDGYASIVVATTGTRTQMICASAATYAYVGYGGRIGPVRELYAYVEKFTGAIDPAVAQRVLADNDQQLPTGAWAIITGADGAHYLVYESYVAADAAPDVVQRMITAAADTTDKLEAEVTGKDDW